MTTPSPVHDWTTDYDIFDPQYLVDPFPVLEDIRESQCPIAHTDRWQGSWLPTRYEDIVSIAHEHETFTSRQIIVTPPPPQQAEGAYGGGDDDRDRVTRR